MPSSMKSIAPLIAFRYPLISQNSVPKALTGIVAASCVINTYSFPSTKVIIGFRRSGAWFAPTLLPALMGSSSGG